MNRQTPTRYAKARQWTGRSPLASILALTVSCLCGHVSAEAKAAVADTPTPALPHHHNSLDDRVMVLSKALDLDATQQAKLKKVLDDQRDQIRKVWGDASMPAAYRIVATQAISDKTADQIRSLLNEEQRTKFNPPRQPRQTSADSAKPGLEEWMNAVNPKRGGQ